MDRSIIPFLFVSLLVACDDVKNPGDENPEEVITTVVLDFTPSGGGDALSFSWADPENDGDPVIDAITLADADDYDLRVSFLNELEDPAEDITVEVEEEGDEHQLFFTGSAVESLATGDNASAVITQTYEDTDGNGFPVGLDSSVLTLGVGSGELTVTLRHLPPEDDVAVKTGTLAEDAASGGLDGLPGETDVSVTFDLTVE